MFGQAESALMKNVAVQPEQAREARQIRPPPPRKILNFRPSEIVSGAILGQNSNNSIITKITQKMYSKRIQIIMQN